MEQIDLSTTGSTVVRPGARVYIDGEEETRAAEVHINSNTGQCAIIVHAVASNPNAPIFYATAPAAADEGELTEAQLRAVKAAGLEQRRMNLKEADE